VLKVALTGNVAAGKSAVAEHWRAAGIPVISADELARQAVAPGSSGLEEVRSAFGDSVIKLDGTLDRDAVRALVFADEEARRRLEAITHPRVWELRAEWTRGREEAGEPLVVAEIPLLFETGRQADFDVTVLVDAPAPERLRRLVEIRGLPEEEARGIMAAQMDPEEKRRLADLVLVNDTSLDALKTRAGDIMSELRERLGQVMRMDLHLHTGGSWDCLTDPEKVLERSLSLGFDRIAMTDHNRLDVALRMAEKYPDRIIPGEEVKTAEKIDVIGLYLTDVIPKGTPARETIERIREQGGIPYLPHPYAGGKGGGGKFAEALAPLVDIVEVFNARVHPGRLNAPAQDLATRHGKLRGAGSDAHTLHELGGASVTVPVHANEPRAFLDAMASAVVDGVTSSNLVHLASTWAKVRKKLPGARHY
jgi:dephospho-CoA kinase